jgi:hypothetical protein
MQRETKIYVLRDPRTNEIRYVGKTVQSLVRRLSAHILRSANKRTHRDCWIAGVLMAGLTPRIEEVDVAGDDWEEKERFWIAHFRAAGFDLTNQTDGGEGTPGLEMPLHVRVQVSARQSARMTPEYRKHIGVKSREAWTPERRAEWSIRMSERYTPEERARRSAHQNSPEMLERQRIKQAQVWTPERRAARSAQVKAQMTPNRIAAHAEKLKKMAADPEWKAKHSATQKAKWTPEMRAAQSERTKAQFAAKRAAAERESQ